MRKDRKPGMALLAAATLPLLLVGVAVAAQVTWDASNFTMDGRKWQPAPDGHQPGKDDPATPMDGSHHPGDDCGICHAPAASETALYKPIGRARLFSLTGTIYDGRAARMPVAGAELVVQDHDGNVVSVTTNDLGNFWTETPLAGDPAAGDPATSYSWRYKAWVKDGGGSRPMMTMPTVGGMTVPRMSCNMHHVTTGTLGGAWARPASTLRSYPAVGLSYRKHVFPILRSKCGPCHIPGPTTAAQAGETFDYGAGLDLLTYGGSAVEIQDSTGAVTTYPKRGVTDVVNVGIPGASLLFAKTLPGGVHGGGVFWDESSADFAALRQWIAEGALEN
ncbi:MAG: hypothetical protein WB493_08170 [Anaeromyxobacteraceae bacterium]